MKRVVFILVVVLMLLSILGAQAAIMWKQVGARLPVLLTAGEAITIGQPVCIAAADGKVYKADANSATRRPCVGFAQRGVASGSIVAIVTSGYLTGLADLTVGGDVFLSETAGAVTGTAPNDAQKVGVSPSATTLVVNLGSKVTTAFAALADGRVWIGDGSNLPAALALSGDATMTNAGVVTVTAATGAFTVGGGYGSTGATISTAGVGQFNGALTVDGASTLTGAIAGGSTITAKRVVNTLALDTETSKTMNATTDLSGTVYISAAAGVTTVTLPAVAGGAGCWWEFVRSGAGNFVITGPAATLVVDGNAGATTATWGTADHIIGSAAIVYGDGAKWYIVNSGGTTVTPS
jgi:hypothetical protein